MVASGCRPIDWTREKQVLEQQGKKRGGGGGDQEDLKIKDNQLVRIMHDFILARFKLQIKL